jgi:hypothetical protein
VLLFLWGGQREIHSLPSAIAGKTLDTLGFQYLPITGNSRFPTPSLVQFPFNKKSSTCVLLFLWGGQRELNP